MKNIFHIAALLLLLIIANKQISAQETVGYQKEKLSVYQQISASYIFGGQVYNDNFIYNPGFQFQTSHGVAINKNVAMGLGVGLKLHDNESFIPIFTEIIGYKKSKGNAPFIKMQFGYAIGWDNTASNIEGYKYKGGLFIDVGMGRKIRVNKNLTVLFQWSYQHQFAKMEYDVFNSKNYTQELNYDMIVITLGISRETHKK